ncbi:MAG: hypothetical protein WB507_01645 [Solirubrobacterales bacterium]
MTFSNVVSIVALFVALGGSAYAAISIPRNSVGTRQLKTKAVTNGKLANGAVSGAKIAEGAITGQNVNLSALGTVPQAAHAASASNSDAVGGHAASCPSGTTLIRGLCFDNHSNPVANNLEQAAQACASKGGWLPTPIQLLSVREILNLGTGVNEEQFQYTDSYYNSPGGGNYRTIVVDGVEEPKEYEPTKPASYYCVYPLVR